MTDHRSSAERRTASRSPTLPGLGFSPVMRLVLGLVAALLLAWHAGARPLSFEPDFADLQPTLSADADAGDEASDRAAGGAAICSMDAAACPSPAFVASGVRGARPAVTRDEPADSGLPAGWERPPERQV